MYAYTTSTSTTSSMCIVLLYAGLDDYIVLLISQAAQSLCKLPKEIAVFILCVPAAVRPLRSLFLRQSAHTLWERFTIFDFYFHCVFPAFGLFELARREKKRERRNDRRRMRGGGGFSTWCAYTLLDSSLLLYRICSGLNARVCLGLGIYSGERSSSSSSGSERTASWSDRCPQRARRRQPSVSFFLFFSRLLFAA